MCTVGLICLILGKNLLGLSLRIIIITTDTYENLYSPYNGSIDKKKLN